MSVNIPAIDALRSIEVDAGSPGCAVVRRFRITPGECTLVAEQPSRSVTELRLSIDPDRDGVEALERSGLHTLAVMIELDDREVAQCSALFRSAGGPRRLSLSQGVALALCVDGQHTVIYRRGRSQKK